MKLKNNAHSIILLSTMLSTLHSASTMAQDADNTAPKVDETQVIASDSDVEATPMNDTSDAAVTAPPKPNTPTPERLNQQQKKLLSTALTAPEPIWLNAGEQSILSFWQADLSGQPMGAVLLLHNEGNTPLTPQTFLNYHQHLPLDGWATLSIELPHASKVPPPARPKVLTPPPAKDTSDDTEDTGKNDVKADAKAENIDETKVIFDDSADGSKKIASAPTPSTEATTDIEETPKIKISPEDIKQQAMQHIQAGIEYLQQQGQFNIVILGDGAGALRALQYMQIGEVNALILSNISSDYGNEYIDKPLSLLNYKNTPTLDIYSKVDPHNKKEAGIRKTLAKKNKLGIYRQKHLKPPIDSPSTASETRLTKTVRGFLNRFVAGMAIN